MDRDSILYGIAEIRSSVGDEFSKLFFEDHRVPCLPINAIEVQAGIGEPDILFLGAIVFIQYRSEPGPPAVPGALRIFVLQQVLCAVGGIVLASFGKGSFVGNVKTRCPRDGKDKRYDPARGFHAPKFSCFEGTCHRWSTER